MYTKCSTIKVGVASVMFIYFDAYAVSLIALSYMSIKYDMSSKLRITDFLKK